jgi:hypothetical protein
MTAQEVIKNLKLRLEKNVRVDVKCRFSDYRTYVNEFKDSSENLALVFLGVYGVNDEALYLLGRDDSGEIAFREHTDVTSEEEKGIKFSLSSQIKSIDGIDTQLLFADFDNHPIANHLPYILKQKFSSEDNDLKALWEEGYKSRNPKVIEAIKGLERIV